MIGAAGVGGGLVIGLTGGLAAPIVAGALAGIFGTTFFASAAGIAIITSLFGVTGAGLTGYRMARRVKDVEEFEFDLMRGGDRMNVSIFISGWLTSEEDLYTPSLSFSLQSPPPQLKSQSFSAYALGFQFVTQETSTA